MNNIGVYGLGVMGQSLARNIMQHGFSVSVYNIETEITKQFTQKYPFSDMSHWKPLSTALKNRVKSS